MKKLPNAFAVIAGLLLFLQAACSPRVEEEKPLTLEELREARQALSLADVSLQLRIGTAQAQILSEVQRRHVSDRLDAATEDHLLRNGAGPALIAALQADENVLTAKQKEVFDQQAVEQKNRMERIAALRAEEAATREGEEAREHRRQQQFAAQTTRYIQQSEARAVSYEVAQADYEAQRKSLEQRLQSLQTQINWRRSHGYNEAELRGANATVDELNAQLLHLTAPVR